MRADIVNLVEAAEMVDAGYRAVGGKGIQAQDAWELQQVGEETPHGSACACLRGAVNAPLPRACEEIRRHLGLSGDPPFDIFKALYDKGYRLAFTALSSISGALIGTPDDRRGCVIVVNSDQPDSRQRWTAAHELAHISCGHEPQRARHVDLYGPARLRIDQEADLLAAELLMPSQLVYKHISEARELSPKMMYQLADLFRVSYAAMVIRCGALSLISSRQVAELRKTKPSKLEERLRLKERRLVPFSAEQTMPGIAHMLINANRLPENWHLDFSATGPLHLRILQAEAAREYVSCTGIEDRRTSVTHLFEDVASWVAQNYPWPM